MASSPNLPFLGFSLPIAPRMRLHDVACCCWGSALLRLQTFNRTRETRTYVDIRWQGSPCCKMLQVECIWGGSRSINFRASKWPRNIRKETYSKNIVQIGTIATHALEWSGSVNKAVSSHKMRVLETQVRFWIRALQTKCPPVEVSGRHCVLIITDIPATFETGFCKLFSFCQ